MKHELKEEEEEEYSEDGRSAFMDEEETDPREEFIKQQRYLKYMEQAAILWEQFTGAGDAKLKFQKGQEAKEKEAKEAAEKTAKQKKAAEKLRKQATLAKKKKAKQLDGSSDEDYSMSGSDGEMGKTGNRG